MPKNYAPESNGESADKKVKPKKKKIWLVLLICLVVLAGSSAGVYFYLGGQAKGEAGEPGKAKKVESESLDMGEMIVNLAGSGGSHYLRIKIILEHPKEKKLAEELQKKKHQISDILISTLRGKTLAEVGSAGSFEGLKASLLKEINSRLEHGEITGIYFTDFLVQ